MNVTIEEINALIQIAGMPELTEARTDALAALGAIAAMLRMKAETLLKMAKEQDNG